MTSLQEDTHRDGTPRGMEKLKGQDNYEDWDVKLLAYLSTHGIDYVLTEPNPADIPVDAAANPHGAKKQVPLPPHELEAKLAYRLRCEQALADRLWMQGNFQGPQPLVNPDDLPDITGQTRIESDAEFIKRCTKYTNDRERVFNVLISSVATGPLAIIKSVVRLCTPNSCSALSEPLA